MPPDAPGRQAGKGFANLQDVFFINHQAISAAQAELKRRMWIAHGAEALVTAREFHFFALVGSARADDGDDGDEGVDVAYITHLAQRNHGGAFDVVNGSGLAGGDERPDGGIIEGTEGGRKIRKRIFDFRFLIFDLAFEVPACVWSASNSDAFKSIVSNKSG